MAHLVFISIYVVWTLAFVLLLRSSFKGTLIPLGVIVFSFIVYFAGMGINSIVYAIWFKQWIILACIWVLCLIGRGYWVDKVMKE